MRSSPSRGQALGGSWIGGRSFGKSSHLLVEPPDKKKQKPNDEYGYTLPGTPKLWNFFFQQFNRYQVPYHVVGNRVMLKIKGDLIRVYHDQELLATYREPETKHNLIGDPTIYEQLKHDKEQLSRKYGRYKGKATRGLAAGSLYADVIYRPLAEYERYAQGGVSWNN